MSEPRRRWDIGGPAPKAVREAEYPIERAVSKYIGAALQVAGLATSGSSQGRPREDLPDDGADRSERGKGVVNRLALESRSACGAFDRRRKSP